MFTFVVEWIVAWCLFSLAAPPPPLFLSPFLGAGQKIPLQSACCAPCPIGLVPASIFSLWAYLPGLLSQAFSCRIILWERELRPTEERPFPRIWPCPTGGLSSCPRLGRVFCPFLLRLLETKTGMMDEAAETQPHQLRLTSFLQTFWPPVFFFFFSLFPLVSLLS